MNESVFLKNTNIHASWKTFLSKEILEIVAKNESDIGINEYTPASEKVLRFLEIPLNSVKILILGQDPYPQPGVATGRAFEVGTLKSWNEPFSNISLKNILRTLYKAYSDKIKSLNLLV